MLHILSFDAHKRLKGKNGGVVPRSSKQDVQSHFSRIFHLHLHILLSTKAVQPAAERPEQWLLIIIHTMSNLLPDALSLPGTRRMVDRQTVHRALGLRAAPSPSMEVATLAHVPIPLRSRQVSGSLRGAQVQLILLPRMPSPSPSATRPATKLMKLGPVAPSMVLCLLTISETVQVLTRQSTAR